MLYYAIPYDMVAYPTAQHHNMPYTTPYTAPYVPYRTILPYYITILYYHTISYTTTYNMLPHCTVPYHTIPYHTIYIYSTMYHTMLLYTILYTITYHILHHPTSCHAIPYRKDELLKKQYNLSMNSCATFLPYLFLPSLVLGPG